MCRIAIVAALEREVRALIKGSVRVEREYQGRRFAFFEGDGFVLVCGGIGVAAARRAAEAAINIYHPVIVHSVGFAGALQPDLRVGEVVVPSVVIDARDGSRSEIQGGKGALVTFSESAGKEQKAKLAQAYGARLVDMEAAAVAASARAHRITFGAIKVISDDASFEMPDMRRFVDENGRFKTASFALSVALRPWLWRQAATLARDSHQAAKALGKHLRRLQELGRESGSKVSSCASQETDRVVAVNGLRTDGRA